jgi:hypothetical protein
LVRPRLSKVRISSSIRVRRAERAVKRWWTVQGAEPTPGIAPELIDDVGTGLGEFGSLAVREQTFDGIESRCIRCSCRCAWPTHVHGLEGVFDVALVTLWRDDTK